MKMSYTLIPTKQALKKKKKKRSYSMHKTPTFTRFGKDNGWEAQTQVRVQTRVRHGDMSNF